MVDHLLALIVFLHNPDSWKEQVYDQKYKEAIILSIKSRDSIVAGAKKDIERVREGTSSGAISWYGTGTPGLYTACWADYPKGTKFKVSYRGNNTTVTCNDRGYFKERGVMLDLSKESFRNLAPLDTGIIRGAKIEIVK